MKQRRGFSLVELVISIGSATVLMAGLTACIIISTSAMRPSGVAFEEASLAEVQRQITNDLQMATRFTERTATAVTFRVPDRDGDGNEEIIRYAWAGSSGDPLTYEYNGSTAMNLVDAVQTFQFDFATRQILGNGTEAVENTVTYMDVAFEGFSETKSKGDATSIAIDAPADAASGDLLIAVITTESDTLSHSAPKGWTQLKESSNGSAVSVSIWWKQVGFAKQPTHTFSWSDKREAYGYIMRFTGHDTTQPIAASDFSSGKSKSPEAPTVTVDAENSLVLRIGGIKDDKVTVDDAGIFDHKTITMDTSGDSGGKCSGGAAYLIQTTTGETGTANFTVTDEVEYVTATIVIQPGEEE